MSDSVDHSYLISAVVAVYNVERYLPALFESLDRQTFDISRVQLIFVDDGSTDGSLELLHQYKQRRGEHVFVLTQKNQWVAAARNAGLEVATGEWVTFTDPDDVLADTYLEEVVKFIRIHGSRPSLNLLAAHQMRLLPSGELRDNHPHRAKFERGSRVVDLRVEPIFQMSVNSAFFRRELLVKHDVRFDGRVRPHFEDGHLIARYLLLSDSHELGLMASAKYLYRTREDDSSLLAGSYTDERKYTNILRHGYLDLLEAAASRGEVPRWLENTVLYELFWYFKVQQSIHSLSASAPAHVFDEFHELVKSIMYFISEDAVRGFDFMGVAFAIRIALLHGYDDSPYRPNHVRVTEVDEDRQLVKFEYWFAGEIPEEEFIVGGDAVVPAHQTVHDYVFYGRTTIRRRILWLPRGRRAMVRLDGAPMAIGQWDQHLTTQGLTERLLNSIIIGARRNVRTRFSPSDEAFRTYAKRSIAQWWASRKITRTKVHDWALATSLRLPGTRNRFAHAWALMDKNDHANDNAEHLYRFLSKHHPETNPWFILERTSPSWGRLRADGFKLVNYGSWRWKQLLLSADHFASSHADYYVTHPLDRRRYGQPRYKFTFLQHGVIHNDISRWVNGKDPHLFITTTDAETVAIAGPSEYKFSDKEVIKTGLPRHDALLAKRKAQINRDLILVIPTWRQYLVGDRVNGSNERASVDGFRDSEYAQRYEDLLKSDVLVNLARRHGKRIAFMPHPHMRPYLDQFQLNADVQMLDFARDDIQSVLARSSIVITDYSSIAFDAAFLDIPVIYYQFDPDDFWGGQTPVRRGYFEYAENGFGPVVASREEVLTWVERVADRGFTADDVHVQRVAQTFSTRDGRSSERVYNAMLALKMPSILVDKRA